VYHVVSSPVTLRIAAGQFQRSSGVVYLIRTQERYRNKLLIAVDVS